MIMPSESRGVVSCREWMRDRDRVAIMLSEEVDTNLEHEHVWTKKTLLGKDQNLEPDPSFIKFH